MKVFYYTVSLTRLAREAGDWSQRGIAGLPLALLTAGGVMQTFSDDVRDGSVLTIEDQDASSASVEWQFLNGRWAVLEPHGRVQ